MRVDCAFTPLELSAFGDLSDRLVIVVDVLRATTTIAAALASGARGVVPAAGREEAIATARSLAADHPLLAGEARARKLEGFDLGNSPREMTPERVADRVLVMATTNGTRTLERVKGGARVLTLAFTNLAAVLEATVRDGRSVLVACSGHEGRPSLEDTACASWFIERLENRLDLPVDMGDGALIAHGLAPTFPGVLEVLWRSEHGRFLVSQGFEADLATCAAMDSVALVPEWRGTMLVASPADEETSA